MRTLLVTALLVLISTTLQAQNLPDPTRFEATIERFEAMDRESMPPEDAIVLTGSSSIARWNDQAAGALAPLTVIPRGFGGSVMNDVLHYGDPRIHYVDVVTPFMTEDGTVMTDIFVEDDLHFNDKGNRIWGETIRAALMPHEAQYE